MIHKATSKSLSPLLIKYTAVTVILLALSQSSLSNPGKELPDYFEPLRQKLIGDGISSEIVDSYFSDDRFDLLPKLLRVNVRQPDAKAAYEGFVEFESVNLTTEYLAKHYQTFEDVLSTSRVDPHIVAAILRVESSLGKYKGKYRLMNVFASLTLLTSDQLDEIAPTFWDHVLKDSTPDEEPALRQKALKRANSKSRWAYRELKTLLVMAEENKIDPLAVKGSWAGAFGLPQFLPTSMKAYGKDGNGDGIVELDVLDDAIASIANYLQIHGYRTDNQAKRKKAVWHYNHSDDYVECILTLAERVKEQLNNQNNSQDSDQ